MSCKNHPDRIAIFDSVFGEGPICSDCAAGENVYMNATEQLVEFPLAQPC